MLAWFNFPWPFGSFGQITEPLLSRFLREFTKKSPACGREFTSDDICAGLGFPFPNLSATIFSGWWFQPIWKIWVKLDHFPRCGVKIKNVWNHHLLVVLLFKAWRGKIQWVPPTTPTKPENNPIQNLEKSVFHSLDSQIPPEVRCFRIYFWGCKYLLSSYLDV